MKSAFGKTAGVSILATGVLLAGCAATAPVIPQGTLHTRSALSQVSVTVDIRNHSGWTPARQEKTRAAARVIETVLNMPEFSHRLALRRDLQRAEGLSGAEILRIILSGNTLSRLREDGDAAPRPIVLALSIAPSAVEYASHDGFTDLDTGIIYARSDWLDNQTICRLAGLLAHEYMHVIGFSHAVFNHPWRRLSVPYAIGDTVTELSEARLREQCVAAKS